MRRGYEISRSRETWSSGPGLPDLVEESAGKMASQSELQSNFVRKIAENLIFKCKFGCKFGAKTLGMSAEDSPL